MTKSKGATGIPAPKMTQKRTTQENTPPKKWSTRSNRGQGGRAEQLANVHDAITYKTKKRNNVSSAIPDNVPINPMAAPPKTNRKSTHKSRASRDVDASPKFLVPPGTEPSMTSDSQRPYQITAGGGRFGFYQDAEQRVHLSPLNLNQDSIDPNLFGMEDMGSLVEHDMRTSDIDEHSPDEDDRAAVTILKDVFGSKQKSVEMEEDDDNGTYNVLEDHQQRNRKPKAPAAHRLRNLAAHHKKWPTLVESSDSEVIPDSEEERVRNEELQSDGTEPPTRKRVKRNSSYHNAKPTQLRFYPGIWTDILERAKQFFRLWLVKECPFPDREVNLKDASNALIRAINEYEAKDCEVEDGYYPEYAEDMAVLIFEDSSTYRGTLKVVARAIVASKYGLENAEWDADQFSNQQGWWDHLESGARELLNKSTFLHDGKDEEGVPNNFNHPALEELCISFYYGGPNAIGNIFPDELGESLPFNAVSLAAAALHCSLVEVRDGVDCVPFAAQPTYKGLQEALVSLLEDLENHEEQGPKLSKLLRKFVFRGQMRSRKGKTPSAASFGLQVYF